MYLGLIHMLIAFYLVYRKERPGITLKFLVQFFLLALVGYDLFLFSPNFVIASNFNILSRVLFSFSFGI